MIVILTGGLRLFVRINMYRRFVVDDVLVTTATHFAFYSCVLYPTTVNNNVVRRNQKLESKRRKYVT